MKDMEKHEFEDLDIVSFTYKGKAMHGTIDYIEDDSAEIIVDELNDNITMPLNKLTYVPPVELSAKQVKKFVRYENKLPELVEGTPEYAEICIAEDYTLTLDDMLVAMTNIKASKDSNETIINNWYSSIYSLAYNDSESKGIFELEETPDYVETYGNLPTRESCLDDILIHYLEVSLSDDNPFYENTDNITKIIKDYLENEKKPLLERNYSIEEMDIYLDSMDDETTLKKASDNEKKLCKSFADKLCEEDNITGLKFKGYGCYGGNSVYECNWDTALNCVTKLYELTGEPVYANTLGYIYYYGRCWDGKPKYDEAFKYFSIGAAGFYYESRYKLADMFWNGYGVKKTPDIAKTIIAELYDQNIDYILNGKYECKFADIALRLGSYTEKSPGDFTRFDIAYMYYLQADFAIKQRLRYNHYGDTSVAQSIKDCLYNLLDNEYVDWPVKSADIYLPDLLKLYLKKYRKLKLNVEKTKETELNVNVALKPFKNEEHTPKLFITETETGFCGMLETLSVTFKDLEYGIGVAKDTDTANLYVPENDSEDAKMVLCTDYSKTIYFDNIIGFYKHPQPVYTYNITDFSDNTAGDDENDNSDERFKEIKESFGLRFMLGDSTQAIITGQSTFTKPLKEATEKFKFASVIFAPGGKRYDYLLDIEGIKVGDDVMVLTNDGEQIVTVVDIIEKSESELALPFDKYKKIIRKF
ncbi:MAG: hypothetical protein K6G11_09425 [Lachnospiraceae bacterium]|nr:hypothetical protein [Lachnospiraceae bacterium]